MGTTTTERLHRLVDALPASERDTAARVLEALGALDAAVPPDTGEAAPRDGESEMEAERAAGAEVRGESSPANTIYGATLDSYFEILAPLDIRVKGTRVGIETILADYLELGLSAEEVAGRYPTLTLEQVYATLTYYWRHRARVDAYLYAVREEIARQRREQELHPSPGILRLRELARQRERQRR